MTRIRGDRSVPYPVVEELVSRVGRLRRPDRDTGKGIHRMWFGLIEKVPR
jgi:hypothetical protein